MDSEKGMSDYGIEIRNEDGNIIVDDVYKNFQVMAYGIADAGDAISFSTGDYEDGSLLFGRPINVNQNDSSGWHIAGSSGSATVFGGVSAYVNLSDPVINMGYTPHPDYSTTPITSPSVGKITPKVEWVLIKPNVTSPNAGDYGLEVYAPDGTVSFATGVETTFDIVSTVTVNPNSTAYNYHNTATFASSDNIFNYWICLSNLMHFPTMTVPGFFGWVSTGKWRGSTNSITFYQPNWGQQNPNGLQFTIGRFNGDNSSPTGGTTTGINSAPIYQGGIASSYTIPQGGYIDISPLFTDPEGGGITLLTSTTGTLGGATVASINNGTTIRVTAGSSDANFTLTITGSDGVNDVDVNTTMTHTAASTNVAPYYVSGINSSYTLTGGQTTTISPLFIDPEGQTLTVSHTITGSTNGVNVQTVNNTIELTPGAQASSFTLNILVSDPSGATAQQSTSITYTPTTTSYTPTLPPNLDGGGLDP